VLAALPGQTGLRSDVLHPHHHRPRRHRLRHRQRHPLRHRTLAGPRLGTSTEAQVRAPRPHAARIVGQDLVFFHRRRPDRAEQPVCLSRHQAAPLRGAAGQHLRRPLPWGGPAGARRPHASAAAGQLAHTASMTVPREAVFLAVRLSRSRPPRLGRSLRSRRFAIALRTWTRRPHARDSAAARKKEQTRRQVQDAQP
jgi:hypothetical protein